MDELLARIRAEILASRWSQNELAKRAGISQSQLNRVATGERVPSLATLERIADALGLRIVVRTK